MLVCCSHGTCGSICLHQFQICLQEYKNSVCKLITVNLEAFKNQCKFVKKLIPPRGKHVFPSFQLIHLHHSCSHAATPVFVCTNIFHNILCGLCHKLLSSLFFYPSTKLWPMVIVIIISSVCVSVQLLVTAITSHGS